MKKVFTEVLDAVDAEKQKILSGVRKGELSTAWLSNIDKQVRQLLSQQ